MITKHMRCSIYICHVNVTPSTCFVITIERLFLFSPLGKPADQAIYFTFRNFSETNYLKIRRTDFQNLYIK